MSQATIEQTDTRDDHVNEERADREVYIAATESGWVMLKKFFGLILLKFEACILSVDINLQWVTTGRLGRVEHGLQVGHQ